MTTTFGLGLSIKGVKGVTYVSLLPPTFGIGNCCSQAMKPILILTLQRYRTD